MIFDGGILGAVRIYNYMATFFDALYNQYAVLFSIYGDVLKLKTIYTEAEDGGWLFFRKSDEFIRRTGTTVDYGNNLNDHLFNDAELSIVRTVPVQQQGTIYCSPSLNYVISTRGWRSSDKLATTINDLVYDIISADIANDGTIVIVHNNTSVHPVYKSTDGGATWASLGITLGYYDEQRVVRVYDAFNYALFGAASNAQPITNVLRVHSESGWWNAGNISDEIVDMRYVDEDRLLVETYDAVTKYATIRLIQISSQNIETIYHEYIGSTAAFGMMIIQDYIFLIFSSNNIVVLTLEGTEISSFQITPEPIGGGAITTINHNFL